MTADHLPHAIAFVGDIHGKPVAFEHTLATALNRGVTSIVQVGDFWIYDEPKEPTKLERIIARACRDADMDPDLVDYRFIDGNHENFDYLTPDATGPVAISEHVTYMPRGTRDRIAGRRSCSAVGPAAPTASTAQRASRGGRRRTSPTLSSPGPWPPPMPDRWTCW